MTNDEVHGCLVEWLAGLLGIVVIKDRQQGVRPANPYAMVAKVAWGDLHDHEAAITYRELETVNSAGLKEIEAAALTELEWTFLFFIYGDEVDSLMRRLLAAVHLKQAQSFLLDKGLFVHDISNPNFIPEFVNERWEPRTQANLIVRGMGGQDGSVVVDTIEEYTFSISGERA